MLLQFGSLQIKGLLVPTLYNAVSKEVSSVWSEIVLSTSTLRCKFYGWILTERITLEMPSVQKKKCNSPKKSHANCTKQYIRAKKIKNSRFRKLGTVRGCKNVQTTKKERNTAPGGRGGDTPWQYTYMGMCRPTRSWFWNSWSRTGYPFSRRLLERGIISKTYKSSLNNQQPFEILHGEYAWDNAITNKSNCVVCSMLLSGVVWYK